MSAASRGGQVGRNDPCPCGSGKKYKSCCRGQAPSAGAAPPAPGPPGRRLQEAWQLEQAGQLEAAAEVYRSILLVRPEEPAALFGLGQLRGRLGDLDEAIPLLERALRGERGNAAKHARLAAFLHRAGRQEDSLARARTALGIDPDCVEAHTAAAIALERLNRPDEAAQAAGQAIALAPDSADAILVMARLERRRGRLDEARRWIERVTEGRDVPARVRQLALNDLGFVLDAQGDYDAAFAAFARCGREQAETDEARRIDGNLLMNQIAAFRARLTPETLSRHPRDAFDGDRGAPAFLVGFPRSGTTMTEQVLAAHPRVITADEEPFVPALQADIEEMVFGQVDLPTKLARLGADQIRDLRARYWQRADATLPADLTSSILVDKQPLNLLELGLIRVIFPDARVIVALRDPRDVCLSCFMQWFQLNEGMVNFLTLERTVELYDRAMDLWLHLREIIDLPFIEVRYEDTVADLEGQARRILALLDLEWDAAILSFHEQARRRSISTPSAPEVIKPVHRRAIGRWQNYRTKFEPLLPRLRPYVEAFGYEEKGT